MLNRETVIKGHTQSVFLLFLLKLQKGSKVFTAANAWFAAARAQRAF